MSLSTEIRDPKHCTPKQDIIRTGNRLANTQWAFRWLRESRFPNYKVMPDKETPLWNVHWQVIYWWTGTEFDDERAYSICYNGQVHPRKKDFAPAYLSFRAVKDVPSQ